MVPRKDQNGNPNSDFKDNWRPSGGSDIACGSSGSGAGSIPGKRESAGLDRGKSRLPLAAPCRGHTAVLWP